MSSLLRRALRIARANLNDIADRAVHLGRGRSLEDLSDEELEAELERRRREAAARAAAREAEERKRSSKEKADEGAQKKTSPPKTDDVSTEDLFHLPPQRRRELRRYYANLELPFGAPLDEVNQAYRRLMRQYHPDRYPDDPARRQLATQLTQKLTRAYNEIKQELRRHKR